MVKTNSFFLKTMTRKENSKTVSFYLSDRIVSLLDEVQKRRSDPTRSDTLRVLLLTKLAEMSYLSEKEKKAFGIEPEEKDDE